jgi:hypothetical protein
MGSFATGGMEKPSPSVVGFEVSMPETGRSAVEGVGRSGSCSLGLLGASVPFTRPKPLRTAELSLSLVPLVLIGGMGSEGIDGAD